ncbi:hypothetical protein L1049_019541 [Liquidambar formosana]|uniref:Myb-like domain-containing protein n=1 Tax=Liquidambar formosana TaxID=63359 RepID=A0AAP0X6K7_LIQFO
MKKKMIITCFPQIWSSKEIDRYWNWGPVDPWSNDEVLALLKVRSSMENWFTDFTWEHVSRRLAELGFKRSAEKCKEKFEEESRYFDSITYNKSYRFFSDLEELCTHEESNAQIVAEKIQKMEKTNGEEEEEEDKMGKEESRNEETLLVVANPTVENNREVARKSKSKKRKRHQQKFEMLKGFCEDMVGKLMARQQELHNKLLEDMVRRDEENIAREEAWKKQEMDRINKEIEIRAHEQAIASDRQATIIDFLKKLTSKGSQNQCLGERNGEEEVLEVPNSLNPPTSPSLILAQNKAEVPTSSTMGHLVHQNPSSCPSKNKPNVPTSSIETLVPQNTNATHDPTSPNVPTSSSTLSLTSQNPNSFNTQNNPLAPTSFSTNNPPPNPIFESNDKENHGKRWPRDEVLALINLRCNLYSSGEDKEGAKGPLWERISQGMSELGYKRSAKRCKEKWENINKYFRKTKDANKKRSLDSRTCPYFHQLSHLYKQGTLVAPSDQGAPENRSPSSPGKPFKFTGNSTEIFS